MGKLLGKQKQGKIEGGEVHEVEENNGPTLEWY